MSDPELTKILGDIQARLIRIEAVLEIELPAWRDRLREHTDAPGLHESLRLRMDVAERELSAIRATPPRPEQDLAKPSAVAAAVGGTVAGIVQAAAYVAGILTG